MLEEVITYLDPKKGEKYLDLTAGYGGHAEVVLDKTRAPKKAVLIDRDLSAVNHLENRFEGEGIKIWHSDFLTASKKLAEENQNFDCILADLGVSSPHLNVASRGFSIQTDGPLDMRMDQNQELTADYVVNNYSQKDLEELIKRYGEEPKSAQIASLIVYNRPIKTTQELAKVISKVWPAKSRLHPATRTFQAIRIAVNDELELLRQSLPIWINDLLAPGGRLVVISFHSLEDRLVKQAFQEAGGDRYDAVLKILTKHPVTGENSELVFNPRARSAKLRAAVKIKI